MTVVVGGVGGEKSVDLDALGQVTVKATMFRILNGLSKYVAANGAAGGCADSQRTQQRHDHQSHDLSDYKALGRMCIRPPASALACPATDRLVTSHLGSPKMTFKAGISQITKQVARMSLSGRAASGPEGPKKEGWPCKRMSFVASQA